VAPAERATLDSVYQAAGWQFLWHQGAQISPAGVALREELENAWSRGLEFQGYPEHLFNGATLDSTAVRDVRQSHLALRMARDLSIGRIDPATLHPTWQPGARSFDGVETLRRLREAARVAAVFDSLEPRDPGYWALRRALPALRVAASNDPLWRGFSTVLRLGDTGTAVGELAARLHQLGDGTLEPPSRWFDSDLAEAVVRFQRRHGLVTDTVVGPATWAALATPLSWRVRQVELALERWRWFSDPGSAALIEVDVPNATVHLRDSLMGVERFAGRVIVGAKVTPTPVMESRLSRVVFNPAWVVPTSIARNELLPHFRADPAALGRGNYELLRDGVVVPASPAHLADIGRTVTVRQRPGASNALGRIKLEVVGTSAIHLHDTPSRRLFARDVRFLSHGCIRVDRPAVLAGLLLGPEWDPARIAAMAADTITVLVPIERRVAVRLMYATADADDEGRLMFRPDHYLRDRHLDAALRRRP
jgi:murein L,D-transpeptidase YcbB/YkuD